MKRCAWVGKDEIEKRYHDEEWGTPLWDDGRLFEFLILEGAQAGLSWITVLKKREAYRDAFDGFKPEVVAEYEEGKIESLLQNEGIIRNRLKVQSAIKNARSFLKVREETGSFSEYIWSFVGGESIVNAWEKHEQIPAYTEESGKMSKDLKRRGFTFVGPTICYAFMQATGMVNDHLTSCYRYKELVK